MYIGVENCRNPYEKCSDGHYGAVSKSAGINTYKLSI